MLKTITHFFRATKKKPDISFFDLSDVEKKKIIEKATEQANKDQKALVEEYKRKFDSLKAFGCKP